jgi:SAM-dependent methyltransferase
MTREVDRPMPLIFETQDYERGGTQKDVYSAEEVVTVPCPLCDGRDATPLYTEHGAIVVSQCSSCSLIYTSTRIKSPEQIYWGNEDSYFEESRLIFAGKATHHRDPNYLEEIKLIERFKRGGRFLDVGCNLGMLLRLAMKRGWEAVGVEPSPSLSRLAARHGYKVHNCFLHELPKEDERSFDVIALSDVLEHICEPIPFLKTAAGYLKDDGVIYIKVPNARWNVFKQRALGLMRRKPAQGVWDSYEHVVHYTDVTLRKMLERGGLQPLLITMGKPVQTPVWHEHVGHYYQYPTPWALDMRRQLGRSVFHRLAQVERLLRRGSIGAFAPNVVAVARKA